MLLATIYKSLGDLCQPASEAHDYYRQALRIYQLNPSTEVDQRELTALLSSATRSSSDINSSDEDDEDDENDHSQPNHSVINEDSDDEEDEEEGVLIDTNAFAGDSSDEEEDSLLLVEVKQSNVPSPIKYEDRSIIPSEPIARDDHSLIVVEVDTSESGEGKKEIQEKSVQLDPPQQLQSQPQSQPDHHQSQNHHKHVAGHKQASHADSWVTPLVICLSVITVIGGAYWFIRRRK